MGSDPRVVIVGGGPAGAVAALVLARRGVRVTVLESGSGPSAKVGETLPPSIAPLLRHLGIEGWLERDGHLRSQGNRSLWGSPEPGESPFLSNPYGEGWHVDRQRFEARLAEAAQEAGAEWRWGCRVERRSDIPAAFVADADFVADATGRSSRLARGLGAKRLRYDRLVGICALLSSPTPAVDTYTLVEATPEGWWYSALLADGRLAVAFLGDGDLLRSFPWGERLRETSATRERVEAHGYGTDSPLRTLPAESSRLDTIAGDNWLALGDAAVSYDPLSSYGMASAMGSGFYGGHAIADMLGGRAEARLAYLDVMQKACGTCLDLQREHYAREHRWPDAPFWQRRHAPEYGQGTL
ncbi:MAG TPA: tryptophan 7-halogenase [Thermoanaerobaculia bacterium]|nr:tryptophan 7-halogenase [Thermoanaerobaculia bacterium]